MVSRRRGPDGGPLRARRPRLRGREERARSRSSTASATPRRPSFADLRTKVHNYWDRGLLGLALDPDFPAKPVRLRRSTPTTPPIGGTAPPTPETTTCPTPPGADHRRLRGQRPALALDALSGDTRGREQVLIEDWCQQFPSHSIGDLQFGADGALYVSGGDGASFNFADYGQTATRQPVRRPARRARRQPDAADAEGGALRARTAATAGDPTTLDGAILRVDPDTGDGAARQPDAAQHRRQRAPDHRLRPAQPVPVHVPARAPTRSGSATSAGTPGRRSTASPTPPTAGVENFGWPCYEGDAPPARLSTRSTSASARASTQPGAVTRAVLHLQPRGQGGPRATRAPPGSSSISGLAFYAGGQPYPAALRRRALLRRLRAQLHLGDARRRERRCPTTTDRETFAAGAAGPVDLQFGPGGDLFYADIDGGTIRRIHYSAGNQAPTAVAAATPDQRRGPAHGRASTPRGSSDPDPATRSPTPGTSTATAQYDDSTGSPAQLHLRRRRARTPCGLRVTDTARRIGHRHRRDHRPATRRPTATIDSPPPALHLEGRRPDLVHRHGDRPAGRQPARRAR